MYIEKVQIQNFGPIKNQRFKCSKDKVNVILGNNGFGKTQVFAAIYAVFFDEEILHHFDVFENISSVSLQVVSNQKRITINQRHDNMRSNLLFDCYDHIKDAAEIDRNKLYFCVFDSDMERNRKYSIDDIMAAQQFLQKIGLSEHHILGTCLAKKEMNVYMSIAEYHYLNTICFLSKIPQDSILFIDGLFSSLDSEMCSILLDVFINLKGVQVFIAENSQFIGICNCRDVRELASDIVFFPGVELRTDKGDTNIHVILIFSDESNLDELVEDFNVFKRDAKEYGNDEKIYWDYNSQILPFAQKHNALISIHAGRKSNGVDEKISNSLPHNQAVKSEYATTISIFEMGQVRDV